MNKTRLLEQYILLFCKNTDRKSKILLAAYIHKAVI